MAALPVTIFSDFTCPYSYVAEASWWELTGPTIELIGRAYELYPEPAQLEPPAAEGIPWEMVESLAAPQRLDLKRVEFRPRTRKSHEAARFARAQGAELELRREIFAAYWGDERDIGRIDVLTELAERIGLDPDELKIALDIDRYAEEVARDQELARRLRIPGTPTMFIGSGAAARVVLGPRPTQELRVLVQDATRQEDDAPSDG